MSAVLVLLDSRFLLDLPPGLLTEVRAAFPTGGEGLGQERHVRVDGLRVLLDGELQHEAPSKERLLETVLMVVNASVIADCTSFAVHAGVVSRGGLAVAWPGVSGAGKTTLTAACLRAGFDYVSDEALALQDGQVRPYPKPLSLSAWSLNAVGLPGLVPGTLERAAPYVELGARLAEPPVRLGHLVVLDRRPGPAALTPAAPAAVAMVLLQHSFNHYKQPEAAFRAASAAAEAARCWTLGYNAPREGALCLAQLVAR